MSSKQTFDVTPQAADPLVSARELSKMYHLYDRPRDRLKQALLLGRKRLYREFWALRDLSFDLQPGERLGIIGRNGSGKSTLLQLIAGILTPTSGELAVRGRVAALLELGSGFNPDFTGRENVFLNAAILGLARRKVLERFDEIAAFADIGDFMDQPVKVYSSGMLVRLAFAVTTSVDADVLLIDEALAVGDVFFRQKCYKRLDALRETGVSILLVTHAMPEIEQFCTRAILLDRGSVAFQGPASEAVRHYYIAEQPRRLVPRTPQASHSSIANASAASEASELSWPPPAAFIDLSAVQEVSDGSARCAGVALCNQHGEPCRVFEQGETASFFYEFELLQDIEVPIGGMMIRNEREVHVHGKNTMEYGTPVPTRVERGSRLRFRQDIALEIGIGEYTFEVGLTTISEYDYQRRESYRHEELHTKVAWLCAVPAVEKFAVVFRRHGSPVQLLHHGIANLPGECHLLVEPARDAAS